MTEHKNIHSICQVCGAVTGLGLNQKGWRDPKKPEKIVSNDCDEARKQMQMNMRPPTMEWTPPEEKPLRGVKSTVCNSPEELQAAFRGERVRRADDGTYPNVGEELAKLQERAKAVADTARKQGDLAVERSRKICPGAPDAGCVTTPDGGCEGGPCMHDGPRDPQEEVKKLEAWAKDNEPKPPGLTPAQIERLALLVEECGEVIHVVGKILRHGYISSSHGTHYDNRDHLECKVGDLLNAINLMLQADDISSPEVLERVESKAEQVKKYLHHQDKG